MEALRHTALVLLGILLAGCAVLEVAEACLALEGDGIVLAFDMESEESEEGQEEEREGPEEEKDKTAEYEAFLQKNRIRLALDGQRLHLVPPPGGWSSMVEARIWEPPELG